MENNDKYLGDLVLTPNEEITKELFRRTTIKLVGSLRQMEIEGHIKGDLAMIELLGPKNDGISLERLLKSLLDLDEEGKKYLDQLYEAAKKEILIRKMSN